MTAPVAVHIYHNPTGARLFAQPIVERLNQAGILTELWCDGGSCSWFGSPARETASNAIRHLATDLSPNPILCLIRLVRLIWCFSQVRPHVVHAHLLRGATLPLLAAWMVGIPRRIYHNHGLPHLGYHGLLHWILRSLERINRAAATHVLMVSRSNLISARRDGLGGHATVLAHGSAVGVDPQRFDDQHCGAEAKRISREQLSIPADTVVIGYAGRAAPHKGLDVLARAWVSINLAKRGVMVLLAGVRDTDLKTLVGSIPEGMRCLGPLDNMPPFYAACDFMVLASRYEGFGYALLEGAAAGLPGIGSDVSGIRCAIEDGVTGILVRPSDPSALASAIQLLVDDAELRQRFGRAARTRVLAHFTTDRVLEALLAYYREDLGIMTQDVA